MASFNMFQTLLTIVLSAAGFHLMQKRPGHTRGHLIAGAAIGGGIVGALTACLFAAGGASIDAVLPFAVLGLADGVIIGLLALAAQALGRWLHREP